MWLLNTETFELELFMSSENHPYAILSHTWEDGEVSFQEMADRAQAEKKRGSSKIKRTCQLARERGLRYAWVDTCCIDKSSSAELTEAINSMFKWYKESAVCLAFLSDLLASAEIYYPQHGLRQCKWFSRGWTLQELVAPAKVEFYDQNWSLRGDRHTLQHQLSNITGIDTEIIVNSDLLSTIPVARRMSWASKRQTTRVEDRAYCLLGIFDVNMPLIYGEGPKAFIRLQEEIIKQFNDLSLFAWVSQEMTQQYRGCLASSPSEFQRCGKLRRILNLDLPAIDFETTNRGIRFTIPLSLEGGNKGGDHFLNLQCKDGEEDGTIALRLTPILHGYARRCADSLTIMPPSVMKTISSAPIHIPKTISEVESSDLSALISHGFTLRVTNNSDWVVYKKQGLPEHLWNASSDTITTAGHDGFAAKIEVFFNPRHNLFRLNRTWQLNRSLHFLVEIGLRTSEVVGGSSTSHESLEPWAAVYQYRTNIRGVAYIPKWHRNQVPPPTSFRVMSPFELQSTSWATYLQHYYLVVSVSTNVSANRKPGMYEVVLDLEQKQQPPTSRRGLSRLFHS